MKLQHQLKYLYLTNFNFENKQSKILQPHSNERQVAQIKLTKKNCLNNPEYKQCSRTRRKCGRCKKEATHTRRCALDGCNKV
jgi:hypothetical protein